MVGTPAKTIRNRVCEVDKKKLLEIKWWNWPEEKIQDAIKNNEFDNISSFIEKYYKE